MLLLQLLLCPGSCSGAGGTATALQAAWIYTSHPIELVGHSVPCVRKEAQREDRCQVWLLPTWQDTQEHPSAPLASVCELAQHLGTYQCLLQMLQWGR